VKYFLRLPAIKDLPRTGMAKPWADELLENQMDSVDLRIICGFTSSRMLITLIVVFVFTGLDRLSTLSWGWCSSDHCLMATRIPLMNWVAS